MKKEKKIKSQAKGEKSEEQDECKQVGWRDEEKRREESKWDKRKEEEKKGIGERGEECRKEEEGKNKKR